MRAEGGSLNLINGVSRQAAAVRLPSQLQESENQFPSVTKGLVPRNPAILNFRAAGPVNRASTLVHFINRDDTERYVVRVNSSGITVNDLDGTPRTVTAPDGLGYLAGATAEDLEAITVADHTFILNKAKTVAARAATAPVLEQSALVHIVTGEYRTTYEVTINGSVAGSVSTRGGPYGEVIFVHSAELSVKPINLARAMFDGSGPPEGYPASTGQSTVNANFATTLPSATWDLARIDNVIYIKNKANTSFTISGTAGGFADTMRIHKGLVRDFSDLPRKAPNGFTIRVAGSDDTDYDDYWVKFDQAADEGQGRWKETIAPGTPLGFDAATMPHILVRNSDGTFTFKRATWADREVGDLETNPWPSFVGQKIRGMVFFKNRMGFLSGESFSMSRAGEFYNFFIHSALTQLDEDPVDAAIASEEVSIINHAVNFNEECILFTTGFPHRLVGDGTFTPKSVSTAQLLANRVGGQVRPVAASNRMFFLNDNEAGTHLYEFEYDRETGVKEAPCVSDHVAGYLPAGVTHMDADEILKMVALHSPEDPAAIFTYKWLWLGQNKAQSAFQRWSFPGEVVGLKFIDGDLYVALNVDGGFEVVRVPCDEAWEDISLAHVYLDRRVETTGVFTSATNETKFATPVDPEGFLLVLTNAGQFGLQPTILRHEVDGIVVEGDYGGLPALAGVPLESYCDLSEIVMRSKGGDGQDGNGIPGMMVNVASVSFKTAPSAFVEVTLNRAYRAPFSRIFSAAKTGTRTARLGELVVGNLDFRQSVIAPATDVTVRLGNVGPYPYALQSYRWTGAAYPTGY